MRSKFGTIEKEEVSIEDKMDYVVDFTIKNKHCSFRNLLKKQCSKIQIIVTFLAILELMKTGKIHITQDNIFDDIIIDSAI